MLDSESLVLRNSLCHAAEVYVRGPSMSVLTMPHPFIIPGTALVSSRQVELSRRIMQWGASGRAMRGAAFGEFYLMNSYHWLWPVDHVRTFATEVLQGLEALQDEFLRQSAPFLEDTYYHFVYPNRSALGYNFVPLLPIVQQLLETHSGHPRGIGLYRALIHSKWTFEIMFGSFSYFYRATYKGQFHVENATSAAAIARGFSSLLQTHNILMARCGRNEASVCQPEKMWLRDHRRAMFGIFAQGLDVCVSEAPTECAYSPPYR